MGSAYTKEFNNFTAKQWLAFEKVQAGIAGTNKIQCYFKVLTYQGTNDTKFVGQMKEVLLQMKADKKEKKPVKSKDPAIYLLIADDRAVTLELHLLFLFPDQAVAHSIGVLHLDKELQALFKNILTLAGQVLGVKEWIHRYDTLQPRLEVSQYAERHAHLLFSLSYSMASRSVQYRNFSSDVAPIILQWASRITSTGRTHISEGCSELLFPTEFVQPTILQEQHEGLGDDLLSEPLQQIKDVLREALSRANGIAAQLFTD